MINEERLWKNLPNFFDGMDFWQEIYHNARRAKAKKFSVTKDEKKETVTFVYSPSILELKDLNNLFTLSGSGWDKGIQVSETPAGWGIYSLFAIAKKLTISSKFGEIEIDTNRWFNDRDYREGWKSLISPNLSRPNEVYIRLEGESGRGDLCNFDSDYAGLWARFIDVVEVNGNIVAPTPLSHHPRTQPSDDLIFEIEPGNKLCVNSNYIWSFYHDLVTDRRYDIIIIWHGQICSQNYYGKSTTYNITSSSVVRPILPTRRDCDQGSISELAKKIIHVLKVYLLKDLKSMKQISDEILYYAMETKLITKNMAKTLLKKVMISYSDGPTEDSGVKHELYNRRSRYYEDIYCPKIKTLFGKSIYIINNLCKSQNATNFIDKIESPKDSKCGSLCYSEVNLSRYITIKFKIGWPDVIFVDYEYFIDNSDEYNIHVPSAEALSENSHVLRDYEWEHFASGSDSYVDWDSFEHEFDQKIEEAVADFTDDYSGVVDGAIRDRLWNVPWVSATVVLKDGKVINLEKGK